MRGGSFVDEDGRTLMLRGVSFIGRPFPLDEADEHFARLQEWGFSFLRLLVPWEAVEHAGPGIYDEGYLEYLRAVVGKANALGMPICVDPHQDIWSRFSGGDGEPGWTLEAAGFDLSRLDETGAAITHQVHGDPFPRMIWPTNGGKLAAATILPLAQPCMEVGPGEHTPHGVSPAERRAGSGMAHG